MLIKKITQFAYSILTIAVERLQKTKSPAFISCLDAYSWYQQPLYLLLTNEYGGIEREEMLGGHLATLGHDFW